MRARRFTQEEETQIRLLHEAGEPVTHLAKRFECGIDTVRRAIFRAGGTPRGLSDALKLDFERGRRTPRCQTSPQARKEQKKREVLPRQVPFATTMPEPYLIRLKAYAQSQNISIAAAVRDAIDLLTGEKA